MEQAECSPEQSQCSKEETKQLEQTETSIHFKPAADQNVCLEQLACSSEQMDRSSDTEIERIKAATGSEQFIPIIEQKETGDSQLVASCSEQMECLAQHVNPSEAMAGSSESKTPEIISRSSEEVKRSFDHSGITSELPTEVASITCTFEEVALTSNLIIHPEITSEPVVCSNVPKVGTSEYVLQVPELTVHSESTYNSLQSVECSTAETTPIEPAKDAEVATDMWSEPWLEKFTEQLEKAPNLWKASRHSLGTTNWCKPKSYAGFAYSRLLAAMDPAATGSPQEKLHQAILMCKDFFKRLKYKMKQAALHCLDAGPDDALRRCPPWVRRADTYLKQMPFVFAQLNAARNKRKKGKQRPRTPAAPPAPQPAPAELAAASVTGARLLRRVVRGLRRAARGHHRISKATAAVVASRVGDTEERVYELWQGMGKLAAHKLRSLLARGDTPTDAGRLDALDWAIVDLLVLYEFTMVEDESYKNYEQLSALLATFHLVQRFDLEQPGNKVSPRQWSEAAHWYSRNRAQMSAVALHRRWVELKMDTRRRFLRRLESGPQAAAPLPLHQAIARRYEHVVVAKKIPKTWKWLVMNGRVAPPTSERGPAPGESEFPKAKDDDDTSDEDAAASEDKSTNDDDVTIVENPPETIDLSEDKSEEESSGVNKVVLTDLPNNNNKDNCPKATSTVIKNVTQIVVVSYRTIDKNIDTSKEIVDLDAPSPESNVLEALQEMDVDNVKTTIEFDSEDEDIRCVEDTVADKSKGMTKELNASETISDSNKHKESQSNNRRESSDSCDGNLVIDYDDNEKDSYNNKAGDANTRRRVWKSIEREMLPDPISEWEAVKDQTGIETEKPVESNNKIQENSKKHAANPVDQTKYPLLAGILRNKCLYDDLLVPDRVKNTKRRQAAKKRQLNRKLKVVTVGSKNLELEKKRGYILADKKISNLVSTARLAEYRENIVSEIGCQGAAEVSDSESGEESDSQEESTIDPKLLMYAVVLLRRIDESPQISRQSSPSPLLRITESPPPSPPCRPPPLTPLSPPNTTIPRTHSHSLFHYFAATLSPSFVFNKHNVPLIKKCKACSVVLRRLDIAEKKMSCRVAKRVELPDIEEVRRNNRSMLTAQVAPLSSRQDSVSSLESTSCNSDSDWTPDGAESDERPLVTLPKSTESSRPMDTIQAGGSAESDGDTDSTERQLGPTSAELGRLLDDLIADGSDGECDHGSCPRAMNADSCHACAVQLLALPAATGHVERLQRRLLRRLASPAQPAIANIIPSTTTVTSHAPSVPKTTVSKTAVPKTTVPKTTVPKLKAQKDISKSSKSKAHNASKSKSKKSATRLRSPLVEERVRARSPVDAEAAAREWLRQKNFAAEKFGVKPRSYKRPAPAPAPTAQLLEPPATIVPVATPGNAPRIINDQVNRLTQSQINQKIEDYQIVMRQEIASVLPLNEDNVAPHSVQANSRTVPKLLNSSNTTLTSTTRPSNVPIILNQINQHQPTPPLFNPNAVADINKKITNIVTLAPNTEPDAFGFRPLITSVQSLATTPKPSQKAVEKPHVPVITLKKAEPVYASYFMNEECRMKTNPKVPQNFVIIPAKQNQAMSRSNLLPPSHEQTQNYVVSSAQSLPQLVNVAGGIQMSSAGAGQGLHLVVTQNQNSPLTSVLNNTTNQPDTVNANQSHQSGIRGTYPQSNIVLNSQLAVMNTNQLSNIVVNSQPSIVVNKNLMQNVQNQQLSVRPGVQANPYIITSMAHPVQSQPLLVSCPSLVTSMATSQPNALFSSMPGRSAQATPMLIRSVQAGLPSGVTAATTPGANSVETGTNAMPVRTLPTTVSGAVESDEDSAVPLPVDYDNESDGRTMSPRLNWEAPAERASSWARARDPAALRVLCTARGAAGLLAGRHLVLSEEQPPPPPPAAAYWSLRPRRRLLMPDDEDEPASKCHKPAAPDPPTKTWLKVKDFARMPEDKTEDKIQKKGMLAPPRVFVDSLVYQKISDEDLLYAKLLVAVSDARACLALLARGAPLQLYCLRTGRLYPVHVEPDGDVYTLSGDEKVSEALVALAQKLYRLPDCELDTALKKVEPSVDVAGASMRMVNTRLAWHPERVGGQVAERSAAERPPVGQPAGPKSQKSGASSERTKRQHSGKHSRRKRRALGGLDQEGEPPARKPAPAPAANTQTQSQLRPAPVAVIELSDED